ncbi:MAG: cupin domain-containing protein, partial [Chloroflexota bacterium]
MAHAGEVIYNPAQATRTTFLTTARDTNGELLQMDYRVAPFGRRGKKTVHIHPLQEERVSVLSGTLTYLLDGKVLTAGPGQVVSLPPPHVHALRNDHGEELHMIVEFRPALDIETFFETMAGLARDSRVNSEGNPNLLQLAVIGEAFKHEAVNANIPRFLQRILLPPLARIGRATGYRERYAKYSGAG